MKPYRNMRKVHCIAKHEVPPAQYAYRQSLCGQTGYCREIPEQPGLYADQFGPVPFVSWRKHSDKVTCKSCQNAMRK